MNKICFFIGVFITLLLAGCSSNPISHVRVATFNIRYDTTKEEKTLSDLSDK